MPNTKIDTDTQVTIVTDLLERLIDASGSETVDRHGEVGTYGLACRWGGTGQLFVDLWDDDADVEVGTLHILVSKAS